MFIQGTYAMLQAWQNVAAPFQGYSKMAAEITDAQATALKGTPAGAALRALSTIYDVSSRGLSDYPRRPFEIDSVNVNDNPVPVSETVVTDKPFMRGIQFSLTDENGEPLKRNVPQILLVAPMSGHFATLLRKTVIGLLPYADVRITDWKNAKNISVSEGKFDLDDFERYVREEIEDMGSEAHVMAVCQPTIATMAAVARMAEDKNDKRPLSMTLLGGPIHPSANMTQPVKLSKDNDMSFFKKLIDIVPFGNKGSGRAVYPGFRQLASFIAMNTSRHMDSGKQYVLDLQKEDFKSASTFRQFYDEFLAVMDMTAEFFLQTIDEVFHKESLANGTLELNGRKVDLNAVTDVAVMTVEGEQDDISAPGQNSAANNLLTGLPEELKFAHLEPEAGHYGIFSGRRFRENIVQRIVAFTHHAAAQKGVKYDPVILPMPQSWEIAQDTVYAEYERNHTSIAPTPSTLKPPTYQAA